MARHQGGKQGVPEGHPPRLVIVVSSDPELVVLERHGGVGPGVPVLYKRRGIGGEHSTKRHQLDYCRIPKKVGA